MKIRFVLKLILFLIPVLGFWGAVTGFAIHVGEAMPVQMVVEMQSGARPVIYNPTDNEKILDYKWQMYHSSHPDVVVLGSSHVLQFRSMMFHNDGTTFYNASAEGWSLGHVRTLVNAIVDQNPEDYPELMIIEMNPRWLYDTFPYPTNLDLDKNALIDLDHILAATGKVIQGLQDKTYDYDDLMSRRERLNHEIGLGLRAIDDGNGYRNDGSLQIRLLDEWRASRIERERELVATRKDVFLPGKTISDSNVEEFESVLNMAAEHGIPVVIVTMPVLPYVFDEMMTAPDYTMFPVALQRLTEITAAHDVPYFNFIDATTIPGYSDAEMYDSTHPSELLTLRMVIEMVKALPEVFAPYADLATLEKTAAEAQVPLYVYGNEF